MSPTDIPEPDVHFYLDLIDVVRDGIICTDLEACIVFVNQSALAMFGYFPEEILGTSLETIYVEKDRERCCFRVIQETFEKGFYRGEFLFQRRDGTCFPGQLSSSWLKQDEDARHLVFAVQDLTEQKKLQRRLLDSQKMASLGKVVEGISHEIRNPIMTLGGYARRLKRTLQPDHPGYSYLQIILEDVQRMEEMLREINDYVAFAQDYRGSFTKLDLQAVLKDALRAMNLPNRVRLEEAFPPEGPWIWGDRRNLRELFLHLLENALEAMPEGGVLRVGLSREDSQVSVKIQDTGVGIADDDLPHIFNPFFSTKTKSTGIGLAKVYTIVGEHAGQIEVQSKIDEGTTFMLSLPVDRRQSVRRDGDV